MQLPCCLNPYIMTLKFQVQNTRENLTLWHTEHTAPCKTNLDMLLQIVCWRDGISLYGLSVICCHKPLPKRNLWKDHYIMTIISVYWLTYPEFFIETEVHNGSCITIWHPYESCCQVHSSTTRIKMNFLRLWSVICTTILKDHPPRNPSDYCHHRVNHKHYCDLLLYRKALLFISLRVCAALYRMSRSGASIPEQFFNH